MSFTYSSTDISTDLAKVRRLIGDTDSANALFTDEEIAFFLDQENDNVYLAAALACDSMVAKESTSEDVSIEGVSVSSSTQSTKWATSAAKFRSLAQGKSTGARIWIGGISLGDMDTEDEDTDRFPSQVKTGMFTNPPSRSTAS